MAAYLLQCEGIPVYHATRQSSPTRLYRDPCECQDELCDILRKTEVIFVCLSCIVWVCQDIIEETVDKNKKIKKDVGLPMA